MLHTPTGDLGFVPFIEHRQRRLSVILNSSRIVGVVHEHWLQLSHQLHWPLTRESVCSLKPGIASCLAINVPDGMFFHQKAILSTLKSVI